VLDWFLDINNVKKLCVPIAIVIVLVYQFGCKKAHQKFQSTPKEPLHQRQPPPMRDEPTQPATQRTKR